MFAAMSRSISRRSVMRMRRMRRRSVAAVTKILQEDRDDGEEYESPDEKV
jgi:hypothetical protein